METNTNGLINTKSVTSDKESAPRPWTKPTLTLLTVDQTHGKTVVYYGENFSFASYGPS